MMAAIMDDGFGEDIMRSPTALEAAHYNDVLRRSVDAEARRKEVEAERARIIFGDCLLKMTKLGVPETKARTMLGKWRGQAKDDALLARVVEQAYATTSPDPISYVTKALVGATTRVAKVESRTKAKWELLGWEKPRMTAKGVKWRGAERGQVWRDPFGKMKIIAAAEGSTPPSIEQDPGIALEA
jgi:hypothetical protein